MRLLLPVVSVEDIVRYKEHAPDAEFYVGLQVAEWYNAFGQDTEMNRMSSFGKTANVIDVEGLLALCNAAKGNSIYITLNAPTYSARQLAFIDSLLNEISNNTLTGAIISEPLLVNITSKYGLKAVASTMSGIYNEDIARWFVKHGFQRLILPRDLTLDEVQQILRAVPEPEYECFIMRNGCRYSDSHCLASHGQKVGALCTYLDRSELSFGGEAEQSFETHDALVFTHNMFSQAFHKKACGLCAIWRLKHMGVSVGKIVGRADGSKSILKDLSIVTENLHRASIAETEEEYLLNMVFPTNYNYVCYQGMNCYYPEVRYGRM